MKLLITRRIAPEAVELLRSDHDVTYVERNEALPRAYLLEHLPAFDGVLTCLTERIDAELLDRCAGRLQAVSNMAVGLDNIDVARARELGIAVYNTPDVVTDSTADLTVGLYLALARKVQPAFDFIRQDRWGGWDPEIFCGRTMRGLVWGIVGLGKIGRAVCERVAAFGCEVVYADPATDVAEVSGTPVVRLPLDDLMARADVVSVHPPLTEGTRHLIDARALRLMKPDAVLVNMARGPVVHSGDLVQVLREGRIAGAALDVFDPEPIRGDHPVLSLPGVIVTPHIGTATVECRREMAVSAARNLAGHFLRNSHAP